MRQLFALSLALFAPLALASAGGGSDGPPSTYLELSPAFVVNLETSGQGTGYAKAEVTLRFHEAEVREKAKAHVPWLRHEIVMLMSGRSAQQLRTSEGQEKLSAAIQEAVSERLIAEIPSLKDPPEEKEGENSGDSEGEQAAPESRGPVRDVLLPNFLVQAR